MDEDDNEQSHSPPKLPPKSRFNDQESTAVLRLLVKQEKLLKNKDENPALRQTPEKSTRHLPPVTPDTGEVGGPKEMIRTKEDLSYSRHLPEYTSGERPESAGGIYQSPKLARAKERPKGSYGRRQKQQQQQQQQHQTTLRPPSKGRLLERDRTFSLEEKISSLKEQTLKLGPKTPLSRTRSCPVDYDTHIPPISQNKHSIPWINSSSTLPNSFSKINFKSGQFHS